VNRTEKTPNFTKEHVSQIQKNMEISPINLNNVFNNSIKKTPMKNSFQHNFKNSEICNMKKNLISNINKTKMINFYNKKIYKNSSDILMHNNYLQEKNQTPSTMPYSNNNNLFSPNNIDDNSPLFINNNYIDNTYHFNNQKNNQNNINLNNKKSKNNSQFTENKHSVLNNKIQSQQSNSNDSNVNFIHNNNLSINNNWMDINTNLIENISENIINVNNSTNKDNNNQLIKQNNNSHISIRKQSYDPSIINYKNSCNIITCNEYSDMSNICNNYKNKTPPSNFKLIQKNQLEKKNVKSNFRNATKNIVNLKEQHTNQVTPINNSMIKKTQSKGKLKGHIKHISMDISSTIQSSNQFLQDLEFDIKIEECSNIKFNKNAPDSHNNAIKLEICNNLNINEKIKAGIISHTPTYGVNCASKIEIKSDRNNRLNTSKPNNKNISFADCSYCSGDFNNS